jgi:hypothetical protein
MRPDALSGGVASLRSETEKDEPVRFGYGQGKIFEHGILEWRLIMHGNLARDRRVI